MATNGTAPASVDQVCTGGVLVQVLWRHQLNEVSPGWVNPPGRWPWLIELAWAGCLYIAALQRQEKRA